MFPFGLFVQLTAALSPWVASCGPMPEEPVSTVSPESPPGLNVEAVVGGTNSAPCAWPSTVNISGCTGTLIHPRVVTTAAHCLRGTTTTARVTFTAGNGMPGSFTLTANCKAGARGSAGANSMRDWGYCVLPEDDRVKAMPITPPLVGCEAERFAKPGAKAWVVGFGTTGPDGQGAGVKRQVEVGINKVQNGILDIGDKAVGACHGDSGGPLYIQLKDGDKDYGWRVLGSTSGAGASRCDCTCSTIYVNIANHVKAIEENEGIDVTPCTNADGEWEPGPDCKDFPSNPQSGTGTYPVCSVQPTTGPIDSCNAGPVMPAAGSGGSGGAGGAGGQGGSGTAAGSGGRAGGSAGSAGMAGAGGTSGAAGGFAGAAGAIGTAGAAGGSGLPITGTAGTASVAGTGVAGTIGTGILGQTSAGAGVAGAGTVLNIPPIPSTNADDGGCSAVSARGGASHTARLWFVALGVLSLARWRRARPRSARHS